MSLPMRLRAAVLAAVSFLAAAPARSQVADPPIAGESFTGEGVTESVDAIMAREAALPREPFRVRETKPEPPPLLKDRQHPLAPAVPSWPAGSIPLLAASPLGEERAPQTVGVSFLGMNIFHTVGYVPPDSMGDVGPSQLLVASNGRIRVFAKSGALGPLDTTTDNFFGSVGGGINGTSDPHVRYDRLSQRWFVSIITVDNCPNDVLLAVSSGAVITSQTNFTFFRFSGEPAAFTDYDTLGVDRFALYIGANIFNCGSFSFKNTSVWVVNKASLLAGTLSVTAFRGLMNTANPRFGIYTPQGVHNDDPQATQGYFVGVDGVNFGELILHRVNNPGGAPTLSPRISVFVPATSLPIVQSQPFGPFLDALEDRLFAAQVHTNALTGARSLWTAHNIQVNSSGVADAGGGRNGSRWYEIGNLSGT
ncbi:MAG TPA: hypothetical protein VFO85_01885, partial [Vicinamibacteria bacterium]|nr:hypothetical protein [Vicinamibacteria bacterium]